VQDLKRRPTLELIAFAQLTSFKKRMTHVRLRLAAGSLWDATQAGTRAANTLKANPAKATPRKTATS
jgi:hypothetical protein